MAMGFHVLDIHHVSFCVSNCIQASFWYSCCLGFERFAEYKASDIWAVALRNGQAITVFVSPMKETSKKSKLIAKHGDFVEEVVYKVQEIDGILCNPDGIELLGDVKTLSDNFGTVKMIKIKGFAGSLINRLVELKNYNGFFLPGWKPEKSITFCADMSPIQFKRIDHVVENHHENTLNDVVSWYKSVFGMEQSWSVDDKTVHTEYSALKAHLITNDNGKVQITVAEPVSMLTPVRGQLHEFLDYHPGPGIQHVAFAVDDIISVVSEMRKRSVEFLTFASSYYTLLRERLKNSALTVTEDLNKIEELGILLDFDEGGYLLQIFTKPVQCRPTFFIEIIQRHNFNGFGAGNFKALFEAVEMEQIRRGLLGIGVDGSKDFTGDAF